MTNEKSRAELWKNVLDKQNLLHQELRFLRFYFKANEQELGENSKLKCLIEIYEDSTGELVPEKYLRS